MAGFRGRMLANALPDLPHWIENADPGKVYEWAETLKQFLSEKFGSDTAAQNEWLHAKVEKLKLGKAQVTREQAAALLQTYLNAVIQNGGKTP